MDWLKPPGGIRNEKSELFDQLNEAIKGREQEFQEWLSPGRGQGRPGRDRQRGVAPVGR